MLLPARSWRSSITASSPRRPGRAGQRSRVAACTLALTVSAAGPLGDALLPGCVQAAQTNTSATPAKNSPPANLGRGTIVVLPENGENMPDLATILVALKRAGYNPPGNQLELIDGRGVFGELSDGWVMIGSKELINQTFSGCKLTEDQRAKADGTELANLVTLAGNKLVTGEFDLADKALTQAEAIVPCLKTPASLDSVYQLFLLKGVLAYQLKRPAQVAPAFEQAILLDSEREWDRNFPPAAWEQFLKVQRRLLDAPKIKVSLSPYLEASANLVPSVLTEQISASSGATSSADSAPVAATTESNMAAAAVASSQPFSTVASRSAALGLGGTEFWLDGTPLTLPVDDKVREVRQGVHLFQIKLGEGGPLLTRWIDFSTEDGTLPVIVSTRSQLEHWDLLFDAQQVQDFNDPTLNGLIRKARDDKRDWMLLVRPLTLNHEMQVRFVNVKKGVIEEAPPQLKTATPQVNLPSVGGHPGRSVNVPKAVLGWQVTAGPQILQQITGPGERYFGLELGGFRTIQGSISARAAFALGRVNNNTYMDLHLGVRKSWDVQPFGLFLEGGLLGCKCQGNNLNSDTKSYLGLEVRGGPTYYFMDPLKQNGVDVNLGLGILFSGEVLGAFGINYHRGF